VGKKTGANPTDRGKNGVKRSVLCDGAGIPIGLAVDGANRHDMKLTRPTLETLAIERPQSGPYRRQHLCLDKAYDFNAVRELLDQFDYTAHIVARGVEAVQLRNDTRKRAHRWVVERTHSWLNRFRRILVRWEKKADNYIGLLHFVFGLIAFRSIGVPV
jgi:putative transposase